MKYVWKYPLGHGENAVPAGEVVHVGVDPSGDPYMPCVWIQPDHLGPDQMLVFYGTGHPIPEDAEHVGSVCADRLVWHVYRVAIQ